MSDQTTKVGNEPSTRNGVGCGAIALAGTVVLAISVYLLSRWESLGGFARASAISGVMLGTLMVLPKLILLILQLYLKRTFGKLAKELSQAGEKIVADTKAMYGQIHEYRPAEESDFDGVDREFYERTMQQLSDREFRHVGDIVDTTLFSLGHASPPIRVFVAPDGQTVVGAYHVNLPNPPEHLQGVKMYTYDVSSEFSDGSFLVTSNTQGLDVMTPPPQLRKQQRPLETPLEELLTLHADEKSRLCAAEGNATCTVVSTMEEVLAGERRQQVIKNNFRANIGYTDPEEVRRIASRTIEDPEILEQTVQAVDDARKKEQSQ
jgi:hypothetical protein